MKGPRRTRMPVYGPGFYRPQPPTIPIAPLQGKALYVIATHVRLPYTGWGIRYNFDQGRWSGPDFGDTFDPGSVIYD